MRKLRRHAWKIIREELLGHKDKVGNVENMCENMSENVENMSEIFLKKIRRHAWKII